MFQIFWLKEEDACGNKLPTKWHKARDQCFNFATFPCDTAILSCVAGLYVNKRGAAGLGCWQCAVEPKCLKVNEQGSGENIQWRSFDLQFILYSDLFCNLFRNH